MVDDPAAAAVRSTSATPRWTSATSRRPRCATAAGRLARDLPAGPQRARRAAGCAGARLDRVRRGPGARLLPLHPRATRRRARPGRRSSSCGVDDAGRARARPARTPRRRRGRATWPTPASGDEDAGLARRAGRAARWRPLGVDVRVRDEDWLAEQGFGGVLAVGGGSAAPPRLIEARWRPRGARPGVHVVLVGKGITFDTGGLNLKPGDGMTHDAHRHGRRRGGARRAAPGRRARLPVRVTALVPAAENSLSGSSYRPGDVVRHVGGRTSEITQHRRRGPAGAGRRAGLRRGAAAPDRARRHRDADRRDEGGARHCAPAGCSRRRRAGRRRCVAAGEATGEPLWRLPLPADYEPLLDSPVADATNAPGNPGAITAALFLRPFAGDVPWAHLDIAGPARAAKDDGLALAGRHRLRRAAARPVGRVAGMSAELVLPLVVRIERADPPQRTDALEAAARAVLLMLTDRRAGVGGGGRGVGRAAHPQGRAPRPRRASGGGR